MTDENWMHFAYEDLETEAVKEREENEKYEAECARPFLPTPPYEPTPTKAQAVKETAELLLKGIKHDGHTDRAIYRLVITLAEAIDER